MTEVISDFSEDASSTIKEKLPKPLTESTSTSPNIGREPSPTQNDAEFRAEVNALSKVIASVSPEVARAATRQNWRRCITGGDHDESFFVRAILKYASDYVCEKAISAYGHKLLRVASDELLDAAVEARLSTIAAKELVHMLARAERLGYNEGDLVDDINEMVIPAEELGQDYDSDIQDVPPSQLSPQEQMEPVANQPPRQTQQSQIILPPLYRPSEMSSSNQPPPQYLVKFPSKIDVPRASTSTSKVCPKCQKIFGQRAGLDYHLSRGVCTKGTSTGLNGAVANPHILPKTPPIQQAKYNCPKCGKGFTNPGGWKYHISKDVCGKPRQAPEDQVHFPPLAPYPSVPLQLHPEVRHEEYYQSSPIATPIVTPIQHMSEPSMVAPSQLMVSTPIQKYGSGRTMVPSELSPEKRAQMNSRLLAEEEKFDSLVAALPENMTAVDRDEQIKKIKASSATRKSNIRKEYGVQVRRSKHAPANATVMPDGGIQSVRTVSQPPHSSHANGRLESFRSIPVQKSHSYPSKALLSHSQPNSPTFAPEAKRRRINLPPLPAAPTPPPRFYSAPNGIPYDSARQETNVLPHLAAFIQPAAPSEHRLPNLNLEKPLSPAAATTMEEKFGAFGASFRTASSSVPYRAMENGVGGRYRQGGRDMVEISSDDGSGQEDIPARRPLLSHIAQEAYARSS